MQRCGRSLRASKTDAPPSRNADDVRHGYRMALAKRHVIVFRESLEKIEVIRVLHQRMDAGRWV